MNRFIFLIQAILTVYFFVQLCVSFSFITLLIFLLFAAACYKSWPVVKYPSWDIWWRDRRNWFK